MDKEYKGFELCFMSWGDGSYAVSAYDAENDFDYGQIVQCVFGKRAAYEDAKVVCDDIRENPEEYA